MLQSIEEAKRRLAQVGIIYLSPEERARVTAATIDRFRALIEALLAEHGVRWIQRPRDHPHVGDFRARVDEKTIFSPAVRDEAAAAKALHELAHTMTPCRGVGHYRDLTMKNHACLACELGAWRQAIAWSEPIGGFTKAMWAELGRCLESYRVTTAGDHRRVAEIDELLATAVIKARADR